MIELFGSALVTFLVIIDPPGCAPIFASLTRGASPKQRHSMALRSTVIAWVIALGSASISSNVFTSACIAPIIRPVKSAIPRLQ